MPTMVEVAIGLILVFLIAAVAASAINEFVEGLLKRRANYLEAAIHRATTTEFAKDLYDTKWVKTLRTPLGRLAKHKKDAAAGTENRKQPAYIPSDVFAAAVRELLEAGAVEPLKELKDEDVATAIGLIESKNKWIGEQVKNLTSVSDIRRTLIGLANNGEFWSDAQEAIIDAFPPHVFDNLDGEARNLQRWYEATMDRMSGWYKRRTKWWLVLWGAVLAVMFNIDTLAITQTLWTDETARAAIVANADEYVAEDGTCTIDADAGDDPLKCVDAALEELRRVETLGLPLGWPWPWEWGDEVENAEAVGDGVTVADIDPRVPNDVESWMIKVLGLLVTAIAVSFGAPVWFDLLNKVINFRASGAKPKPGGTSGALDHAETAGPTTDPSPNAGAF